MGDGLDIEFIDHFNTPHGTTSSYSATTNLHTLQITAANNKFSPARSAYNSHFLGVEIFRFPRSGPFSPANIPQLNPLNSTQLAWSPSYIASGRTQKKTSLPTIFLLLLLAVSY
jgi:hypothetical protein